MAPRVARRPRGGTTSLIKERATPALVNGPGNNRSSHVGMAWSTALPWMLGALACAVLITQFFQFAVLSTVHRQQWHGDRSHRALCLIFYQVYWAVVAALVVLLLGWLYFTDRWAYKTVYALLAFMATQALQLVTAVLLTSWADLMRMVNKLQNNLEDSKEKASRAS